MDGIQRKLLEEVAGLHEVPQGAYSLRINGSLHGKNSSENDEWFVQKKKKMKLFCTVCTSNFI